MNSSLTSHDIWHMQFCGSLKYGTSSNDLENEIIKCKFVDDIIKGTENNRILNI